AIDTCSPTRVDCLSTLVASAHSCPAVRQFLCMLSDSDRLLPCRLARSRAIEDLFRGFWECSCRKAIVRRHSLMLTSYRGCSLTFADIRDQLWVDDVQGWFLHNID